MGQLIATSKDSIHDSPKRVDLEGAHKDQHLLSKTTIKLAFFKLLERTSSSFYNFKSFVNIWFEDFIMDILREESLCQN